MKKPAAFTLIELLVVISVIALLLSILIPSLNIAKQQATGTVCLANLRTLSTAWHTYAQDNNDKLVGGSTGTTDDPWYCWVEVPPLDNSPVEEKKEAISKGLLWPYTNNAKAYHCPGDQRYKGPPVEGDYAGTGTGAYRSYSIAGGFNGVEDAPAPWDWGIYQHKKFSTVRRPSEKYVFVEEADGRGYNKGSWVINPTGDQWVDPLAIWHNKKSTLGFADGHSEMHRWLEESTLEMSEAQDFYAVTPNSRDLEYMQKHYAYIRLSP